MRCVDGVMPKKQTHRYSPPKPGYIPVLGLGGSESWIFMHIYYNIFWSRNTTGTYIWLQNMSSGCM